MVGSFLPSFVRLLNPSFFFVRSLVGSLVLSSVWERRFFYVIRFFYTDFFIVTFNLSSGKIPKKENPALRLYDGDNVI